MQAASSSQGSTPGMLPNAATSSTSMAMAPPLSADGIIPTDMMEVEVEDSLIDHHDAPAEKTDTDFFNDFDDDFDDEDLE